MWKWAKKGTQKTKIIILVLYQSRISAIFSNSTVSWGPKNRTNRGIPEQEKLKIYITLSWLTLYNDFYWETRLLSQSKAILSQSLTPKSTCAQCTHIAFLSSTELHRYLFRSLAWSKVIYPKYSKHWLYTVAHTIDCVCSKMLNHGLNHGLFLSQVFWMNLH